MVLGYLEDLANVADKGLGWQTSGQFERDCPQHVRTEFSEPWSEGSHWHFSEDYKFEQGCWQEQVYFCKLSV